jgi:hypothetical protein
MTLKPLPVVVVFCPEVLPRLFWLNWMLHIPPRRTT